jgi:hypothetical protein
MVPTFDRATYESIIDSLEQRLEESIHHLPRCWCLLQSNAGLSIGHPNGRHV